MLDALLSGLLFERWGDPARAIEEIPLARRDATWCGSQALLEGPCEVVPVTYTMALRPERDLSPENVRPDGRGGKREYVCKADYELIVCGESRERFMAEIGFLTDAKNSKYRG